MKFFFLFLTALFFTQSYAQVESRKPFSQFDYPQFYVDAMSFAADDSAASRVDLYIQVPYDQLQFVKEQNQYAARYEIQVNIIAGDHSSITEKLWNEEVRVNDFSLTQKKSAYNLTQRSVVISPGSYTVRTQIRDLESKKTSVNQRPLIVDNYSAGSLCISDVMLVNRVTAEGEKRNIVPNVSGTLEDKVNAFYVFFEIYHAAARESLQVRYTVRDAKGKLKFNQVQHYLPKGSKTQLITKFDSINYTVGTYTLSVELSAVSSTGEIVTVAKQKKISVHWFGVPLNITDLDLAVKQTRYIATVKEFDAMNDAPNEEEKRKLFEAFWKKRDPSPDTKRNENMEEYFSRVAYANEHFSHYQAGWKTDMGMVFILFGAPDNVERHPFDIDTKPYELWSYYEYNRTLLFIDESGFGDYRLDSPIGDMLQRLKIE